MKIFFLILTWSVGITCVLRGAERPNILWITSEDNGWNWLGCYGNAEARTPCLDAFAKQGLLFTHAYSNAAVCAVARSTILNGAYSVTQGTQHMRSRHPIPPAFKSYVAYLREAGYYCTNNSKTDYNFKGNDNAIWNECSSKASYANRPADQPFFAVFNLLVSHESSLFPGKIAANRKHGIIPQVPQRNPAKVDLPPYLPDLPEIRSDIAIYHDTITALDQEVGGVLDQLKTAGLADDTIVFYYSDHGGILPRGKRYLEDTGVRVPMLIHVPEKWRSLSPFKPGEAVAESVAFVDLAPTLLSLVGLEKPAQMQGRAFLGPKRVAPAKDDVVFLYADRFDEIYGMRRGITDGRWKYLRCFTPHLPAAPYSYYQFEQAGWTAWWKAWKDGKLKPPFDQLWENPQPFERLFDTLNDPWEIRDLAADPAHADRLAAMRGRLKAKMIEVVDTGLIPEPMFEELSSGQPIATYLAGRKADLPALVNLAFAASAAQEQNLTIFRQELASKDPLARYWAATGCLILGKAAAPAKDILASLLGDKHSAIRVAAGQALFNLGEQRQGKAAVLAELENFTEETAQQNAINVIDLMGATDEISDLWVKRILSNQKEGEYLKRHAKRLKERRNVSADAHDKPMR
jgi:arylsulfatase A-like enzyme